MPGKERKGKKPKPSGFPGPAETGWWTEDREFETWLDNDAVAEFDTDEAYLTPSAVTDGSLKLRLDHIKQSHELLKQFSPKELRLLLNLKRNTSAKAWSLREDLLVLTVPLSNREISEMLTDRNKEAVKKRLQLLKSKGLAKRQPPPPPPPAAAAAHAEETQAPDPVPVPTQS